MGENTLYEVIASEREKLIIMSGIVSCNGYSIYSAIAKDFSMEIIIKLVELFLNMTPDAIHQIYCILKENIKALIEWIGYSPLMPYRSYIKRKF